MARAAALGRRGLGLTSPNPAVGCVIVKDARVVSSGFHQRAGEAHAERVAINRATESLTGATLYVTLEPCSHWGQTPPCTDLIIESGISRVVYGVADRDPRVSGIAQLRAAGVEVSLCEYQPFELVRGFFTRLKSNRPYVTLKLALTQDGGLRGHTRTVSCPVSHAAVQRMRSRVDAILIGNGTLLADNPALTNRLGRGARPIRVVVGAKLQLDFHKQLADTTLSSTAVIYRNASAESEASLLERGVRLIRVPEPLPQGLYELSAIGVQSVLCEGGASLGRSLCALGLVDEIVVFRANQERGNAPYFSVPSEFNCVSQVRVGQDTKEVYVFGDNSLYRRC
jgi:diaminohydroxyphosphoribosylaminopyrimidine deaminase / 5-amino-6-(5-phosphoribosylamino)uracil reductase